MTKHVQSQVTGNLGVITLNRPEALNALTTQMCIEITRLLQAWEKDNAIGAVLIRGAGGRAFCAGGDVVMLHNSGKACDGRAEIFWRTEYALNDLIQRYAKPYIALVDGIVMGGGVGLSVHGRHRIAGDHIVFAMPETGIGYFPDVGGSYFLPRLSQHIGIWLGLTGARLKMAEACEFGIFNAFIPSADHDGFVETLGAVMLSGSTEDVLNVMQQFTKEPQTSEKPNGSLKAFSLENVPKIIRALSDDDSDWAQAQLKLILRKSPLALAVTFEAMRRGAHLKFKEVMAQELYMSLNFLKTDDFYEGIRALLIDKDRNPKWMHENVNLVTKEQVERFFDEKTAASLTFLD